MTDLAGRQLGHYVVTERLGQGGMGVVYRARDSRLDRDVALKVLPPRLADDRDCMARFEREARLLAALNHPNVATLHGLEEHDGQRFLVMELAAGQTLAARIAAGPLPIDEALDHAVEIARGLEAAHAQGTVHRDLKPANIMLSAEGRIKVLDFGLAKALDPQDSRPPMSPDSMDASPTATAGETRSGTVLGTAAYMSPEQARGRPVDRRTDIWAFGCVLWEMLTGRRAFTGNDISEYIAAILKEEPDWGALPPGTPTAVERVLRQCLRKDPDRRLHDVADARIALEEAGEETPGADLPAVTVRRGRPLAILGWVLAAGLAGACIWAFVRSPPPSPAPVARLRLPVPKGQEVKFAINLSAAAISPDGTHVVYIGPAEGGGQLWLRSLDEDRGAPIPGTSGSPGAPVFSPDGRLVVYREGLGGALQLVPVTGAAPVRTLVGSTVSNLVDWGPDGMVYFGVADGGINRVPTSGGEPQTVVAPRPDLEGVEYSTVDVLPNGKGALVTIWRGSFGDVKIGVVELATGALRPLADGFRPQYATSGHVVFQDPSWTLVAAPFDQRRLQLAGSPATLRGTVSEFFVSAAGVLLEVTAWRHLAQPVWVDRSGTVYVVDADWAGEFLFPSLSPDGSRLAVSVDGPDGRNIWVKALPDGVPFQLTFSSSGNCQPPVWTPDGEHLSYFRFGMGLVRQRADGNGAAELLLEKDPQRWVWGFDWSPDARWLVYQLGRDKRDDIYGFRPGTDEAPTPLVDSDASEVGPAISADGRWLAYASNRTGRFEVYVRPFPNVDQAQWQVSTGGGSKPVWAHNGRELFYVDDADDRLVAVEYATEPAFHVVAERTLFPVAGYLFMLAPGYAVASDDQRFLMLRYVEGGEREVMLTLNFHEELRRVAPRGE